MGWCDMDRSVLNDGVGRCAWADGAACDPQVDRPCDSPSAPPLGSLRAGSGRPLPMDPWLWGEMGCGRPLGRHAVGPYEWGGSSGRAGAACDGSRSGPRQAVIQRRSRSAWAVPDEPAPYSTSHTAHWRWFVLNDGVGAFVLTEWVAWSGRAGTRPAPTNAAVVPGRDWVHGLVRGLGRDKLGIPTNWAVQGVQGSRGMTS
jgi:hypothetical protein